VAQILVRDLKKTYRVHHKEPGFLGSLGSFFHRRGRDVRAVDGISLEIGTGEVVGFLGPNGAGKTTTLKVLSGLLYPSAGQVRILGYVPHQRKPEYLKQITLVMGQKNQLMWDLPALESFLVHQAIYAIPRDRFHRTLEALSTLLELEPLLKKQVRKLSLGERMKCELAVALLHEPKVLFLDEPTIGLDVTMQARIRRFIADYNARTGATVILTSHYMADVTALCRRIILIDRGRLIYDGALEQLVTRVNPLKVLKIVLRDPVGCEQLSGFGEVVQCDGLRATLRVPRTDAAAAAARLLTGLRIADLTIEDPPVEDIISQIFAQGEVPGPMPWAEK